MPRTSPLSSSIFHAACALSAPAGHLPLEGKAAIREYPLLKKVAHHPCEPIRSPSTVIPSAAEGSLLHCRHMHTCALTQTTPWCFLFRLSLAHDLPLCKKDPSTSVGMTGGRRVISHSLSHRCVDPSCAFGAPPSLRGYSYRNITPLVQKHATYLPDENPFALAYRHPERTKTLYV